MQVLLTYAEYLKENLNLKELKKEKEDVIEVLDELDAKGILRLKIIPNVTKIEDITKDIKYSRAEELVIFGFSGHSSGSRLILGNSRIRCEGLANLIGRQKCPNIKIVLLNGCLTYRCLSNFELNKVPIIITTVASIDDGLARKFSVAFFESLANNLDVYDAFNSAIDVVKAYDQIKGNVRFYSEENRLVEDKLNEKVPDWQISFREERYKKWNFTMGLKDPEPETPDFSSVKNDLIFFKTLFEGNLIYPKDCIKLDNFTLRLETKLSHLDLTGLEETSITFALDRIRRLIKYFKKNCLNSDKMLQGEIDQKKNQILLNLNSILKLV